MLHSEVGSLPSLLVSYIEIILCRLHTLFLKTKQAYIINYDPPMY